METRGRGAPKRGARQSNAARDGQSTERHSQWRGEAGAKRGETEGGMGREKYLEGWLSNETKLVRRKGAGGRQQTPGHGDVRVGGVAAIEAAAEVGRRGGRGGRGCGDHRSGKSGRLRGVEAGGRRGAVAEGVVGQQGRPAVGDQADGSAGGAVAGQLTTEPH